MHGAAGLPAALIAAALLAAAPAGANTGRVAFPVGLPAPADNVDATGATAATARPGGGAVLVGDEPGRGFVAAALDPGGALDPAFGSSGVSHVRVRGGRFMTLSVLARPDGRLVVIGTLPPANRLQLPDLVAVGLTASGRLDASFGVGGVARPGLQGSCGNCSPAALTPDGSLVVTGNTGSQSPEIAHDPNAPDTFAWAVTRLTAAGQPDPAFGVRPVPGATPGHGFGYGAAVAADGRITLLGAQGARSAAARLLPGGSADPSFAGGGLATVPSSGALNFSLGGDGSITALGMSSVSRLRPDGSIDDGFGDGGSVRVDGSFARLLEGAGGGEVLVYRPHVQAQPAREPAMVIDRLDAAGRRTTAELHLPFGGGVASFYGALRFTPSLDQNAFRAAALLPRPGGGYLAAGGVTIQQYSGEGEGASTAWFAGAALTPALALDHAYGPGKARVSTSVRVVRQRARASRRLRGIAVRIRASAPGLARVRVRDRRGRMLARGVEPLYAAGSDVVRVPLTRAGRRALRHGPVRVRVSSRFRSVLAAEAAARGASGTLR